MTVKPAGSKAFFGEAKSVAHAARRFRILRPEIGQLTDRPEPPGQAAAKPAVGKERSQALRTLPVCLPVA